MAVGTAVVERQVSAPQLANVLLLDGLLRALVQHERPARSDLADVGSAAAVAAYQNGASLSEAVRVGRREIEGP